MQKWECPCGYIYDPAEGDHENGVDPTGFALSVVLKKKIFGKPTNCYTFCFY